MRLTYIGNLPGPDRHDSVDAQAEDGTLRLRAVSPSGDCDEKLAIPRGQIRNVRAMSGRHALDSQALTLYDPWLAVDPDDYFLIVDLERSPGERQIALSGDRETVEALAGELTA